MKTEFLNLGAARATANVRVDPAAPPLHVGATVRVSSRSGVLPVLPHTHKVVEMNKLPGTGMWHLALEPLKAEAPV